MAVTVNQSDVLGVAPTITPGWAQTIAEAVTAEAAAAGDIPFTDLGGQAQARLVMLQAVRLFALGKPWLTTETTGPYGAGYRQLPVTPGILSVADLERLRALAGTASATPPAPLGSFPEPVSYSHLFWPGGSW